MKIQIKIKILLSMILLIMVALDTSAAISNTSVRILTQGDYSDIWLGFSTGGYDLIAEKDSDFVFRVFLKNGMPNSSLNNVEVSPDDFPFIINSITPKTITQVKPMEIVIFHVNITIPPDQVPGKYPVLFDAQAGEFPKGVFQLNTEIKVVERLRVELYTLYAIIIIGILGLLLYRKFRISKEGK